MTKILSITNIFITLALVILGSLTHSTSAGLECPSWPICYQSISQTSFTSYALLHRILAGLLIVSNILLVLKKPNNSTFKVGLGILIIQSVLGAVNVFYKFPSIMSVAHLYLSVAYIVYFVISLFNFNSLGKIKIEAAKMKDFTFVAIALVLVQFFLGGIINHTSASLECSSLSQVSFQCFELNHLTWWPLKISARINMLHRFNAILILLTTISILGYAVLHKIKEIIKPAVFLIWLILIQIFMASPMLKSILVGGSNLSQVAHLLVALIVLITLFYIREKIKFLELVTFQKTIHTFLSDLFELTKPRLGLLVVATILSGVLISAEMVDFFNLIWALFLSTLIVAAATTLNCYIEKDVDLLMDRTKNRALPSGRLSPKAALVQGCALILFSIPMMIYTVNTATALLGLTAFVFYLFLYTPMKLKSPFALYVGAIPGAIPPVMGRTIVVGYIDELAWILFAVLFIWQLPHFLAISIYHNSDYKTGGIKVYPHFWSEAKLKIAIFLLTIILVLVSLIPFYSGIFDEVYFISVLVLGLVFIVVAGVGFVCHGESLYINWARKYFLASIIYLPLLMAAMIFLS